MFFVRAYKITRTFEFQHENPDANAFANIRTILKKIPMNLQHSLESLARSNFPRQKFIIDLKFLDLFLFIKPRLRNDCSFYNWFAMQKNYICLQLNEVYLVEDYSVQSKAIICI